jgi:uncharacterized protein YecA (UPF0149 family)
MKLGRNDPCHCGSGKKYKKCHEAADDAKVSAELAAAHAKALAEKEAADAEAEANPEPGKKGKEVGARDVARAASRPKSRIATVQSPIRRGAV